jgi:hypothetical protein
VPCSLISPTISKIFSTNIGREPERRLVQHQRLRTRHQRTPIAHTCCSPPESVPPLWLLRSARLLVDVLGQRRLGIVSPMRPDRVTATIRETAPLRAFLGWAGQGSNL